MSPTDYVERIKAADYPAVASTLDAGIVDQFESVLSVGYDKIGTEIETYHNDMTPEAVEIFSFLEGFLVAFVEHLNNFELVRGSLRSGIYN